MTASTDSLVFVPLGGLGEIGMNAALYGFGPKANRQWILVDCGVSFAQQEHMPGIDLIYPDLAFIEARRKNLLGIVITHAHEDHIGALVESWPRLQVPVYATGFALGLLEARRLSEPNAPKIPLKEVRQGNSVKLGPFDIEFVAMSHSIPESSALAIRTPLGLVVHSGDWKLDPTPVVGLPTNEARLKELGDEGVLALVCDSTNVVREGVSPSEQEVGKALAEVIKDSPQRVCVTAFASNVARIRSVAEAAVACGREVVVVGRGMERVIEVAEEAGYLSGLPPFRSPDSFGYLPRDKVVALLTGSQGEPRAALSRIATDDHPAIGLSPGDRVVFSSRTIPGNERAVGAIINSLVKQGIEVVTDRDRLVHASGHPRRGEMAALYDWLRPQIAIPAHGEALHLAEHATFARRWGAGKVVSAYNGDMVQIAPDSAGIVEKVPAGRLFKDGDIVLAAGDPAIAERRRLAFAGVISVALAVDDRGGLVGDPDIAMSGIPAKTRSGESMADLVADAVDDVVDNLPRPKRRDPTALASAVERAVRAEVRHAWGKKPLCHVLVVRD